MMSIIERCCRTCVDIAPDHYRAGLRCVSFDRPVSADDVGHLWWLNEDVVGGKADRRDVVVVSTAPDAPAKPRGRCLVQLAASSEAETGKTTRERAGLLG